MKTKIAKPIWMGLVGTFLLALGLSAQANIITIDETLNRATVDCTAGVIDPACLGVIGAPPSSGELSDEFARIYDFTPVDEVTMTDYLNTLMGINLSANDATRIETGGKDSVAFVTTAAWFAIKTGLGVSFFKNEAGALDLTVLYQKSTAPGPNPPGAGMGISNVTFWGGETTLVPEPGTMALFGLSLLGLALMLRRRLA